jgi:hypothetical protein
MNTYFVLSNRNNMFYYYKNVYYYCKKTKVHIHIIQITKYILNGILSNFIVNKKVK